VVKGVFIISQLTLAQLKVGDRVRVATINIADKRHLRKLAVFGVLPGVELEILQVRPTYVLRIGHTELALDKDIANNIGFII